MELWSEVRRRVLTGEMSKRAACREYGFHWQTLEKILGHVEPPGYRQQALRQRPKLEPFLPFVFEILESDKKAPRKQRHTAQRIYDRLVTERGFDGGYTSVKDVVRQWKQGRQEVFLPLAHPPGEAQVDFGFAEVELAGQRLQVALFVMTLPCLFRTASLASARCSNPSTKPHSSSYYSVRNVAFEKTSPFRVGFESPLVMNDLDGTSRRRNGKTELEKRTRPLPDPCISIANGRQFTRRWPPILGFYRLSRVLPRVFDLPDSQ